MYRRALAEVPDDVDALAGLGMAYSNLGRPSDALDAYRSACDIDPGDPVLRERLAETLGQLGLGEEAAKAYLASAELYRDQEQAPRLAVSCWERAANADPGCLGAHVALLKYYQRCGLTREAVDSCIALARTYRDHGRSDFALRICQHALQLSPRNPEALALLDRLRSGSHPSQDSEKEQTAEEQEPSLLAWPEVSPPDATLLDFTPARSDQPMEDRGSPIEITRRRALTDLAESVFDDVGDTAGDATALGTAGTAAAVSKAVDLQTRGRVNEAVAAYEELIDAGANRPSLHFSLGLLYRESRRFEDAIWQLQRAAEHPDYGLGSHFALGECHRAQGHLDEAARNFLEVLKIIDLATVDGEQAEDLLHLYQCLADGLGEPDDREQALEFTNTLVTFLSEQGWESKVRVARRRLDVLTKDGPAVSLAEALTVPGSERILESISMSDAYASRGAYYAAMEECHLALKSAPNSLTVHRQIADILLKMDKVDEAVKKLIVVADAYQVRGNPRQAAAMYRQILGLAPMNTRVRARLIALLVKQQEFEQALQHYMVLADSYYQLARLDQARDVYQEALGIASDLDQGSDWTVRILHRIGDLDMQRVDWRKAISVYQQILEVLPDDERARLMLLDLLYRLDEPRRATEQLDELLRIYREADQSDRVLAVLEDLIDRWPGKIAVQARLAQAHLDAGNATEALEHLDKLGDLQLESQRVEDAKSTIRAIVALRPPNVASYETLLKQLETGQLPHL
jgi:tetratricopeptide (TPR) repeat protein